MILIRKIFPFLIIVSFMFPGFLADAVGQESIRQGDKSLCKIGNIMRRVEIQYYEQEKAVPCEVHYYKDTEAPGEQQVLWRALNETGYCERKTEELIARLQGWGWTCGQTGDSGPKVEPEQADDPAQGGEPVPGDDTEALEPAAEAEPTEDE